VNLSASFEISLSYQVDYYYLLDNPVSEPSFVPTVIAALHPSNTRRKKGVKGVKAVSNAVEPFIDVLDGALEVGLLLRSEFGRCSFVGCLILSMLGI